MFAERFVSVTARFATVVALTLVFGIRPGLAAADLESRIEFDIPAQQLPAALLKYSRQSGVQVTSPAQLIDGKTTRGVVGTFPARQGLERLLVGTALAYEVIDPSTVVIRVAQAEQRAAAASSSIDRADTASAAGPSSAIEEIVVTAQKREERLIDTPQSVSVLTAADFARLGATQFRDFANTVPGLTYTTLGPGYTQINLRGVTSGIDISSTVGIYLDDVPYGSSSAFTAAGQYSLDSALFGLDRIEVLRGPQGTLYGAASMGGLIKYVSKAPSGAGFSGNAQAGVSNTQDGGVGFNVAGTVNAPLVTDRLALRASAYESHDGGFIDNVTLGRRNVNRSDTYGGRLDFLYAPTEALSVRIGAFLQDIHGDGQATANYTAAGTPVAGELAQTRLYAEPFDQRYRLVSATVSYDLGPAQLTSISSFQTARTHRDLDSSHFRASPVLAPRGYSAIGQHEEVSLDKLTQEVRLASLGAQTIEWQAGLFYTRESAEKDNVFDPRDANGQAAPNDVATLLIPTRYEEYAAFADLTYRFTEKLDVTGGMRYARNDQTVSQFGSGLLAASRPERSASENVATWLANARYRFGERSTGYLRFATGYRPGGPNIVLNDPSTGLPLAQPTFDSDSLKSYEAGYRVERLDRRLSLDMAVYHIDWRDMQINAVRNGVGVRTNAGDAMVQGAELAVTARPLSELTIAGAFGFTDATLSEAFPDLGGADGERLINVPRFTGNLSADYGFAGPLHPTVGATVRQVSNRKAAFGPTGYRLTEYTVVDLRTGLTVGTVDLQLYVHNLLDDRSQLSEFTFGGFLVALQQPRSYGITATASF